MLIFLLCVIVSVLLFGKDLTLAILGGAVVIGGLALGLAMLSAMP